MVTRHEFLARLHHLLAPKLYMETGVDGGASLKLASCRAIGIDPAPHVQDLPMYATVVAKTSDAYFAELAKMPPPVLPDTLDLGFIDGMHLYEFALRDFMNMERYTGPKSVIVFDDMLPMTQAMTNREMVAGDWTGDVWKVFYILRRYRPDLSMRWVDTFPTGTLMIWNLDYDNRDMGSNYIKAVGEFAGDLEVPPEVLFRTQAVTADRAIEELKEWL